MPVLYPVVRTLHFCEAARLAHIAPPRSTRRLLPIALTTRAVALVLALCLVCDGLYDAPHTRRSGAAMRYLAALRALLSFSATSARLQACDLGAA
eukprot:404041-Pleurochrysis_carterae.AAC.1